MSEQTPKYKFAMIFSAGKDSAIAMDRMIREGHTPVCLITAYNQIGLSHMHLIRKNFIRQYGEVMDLPVIAVQMNDKYDFDAWKKAIENMVSQYDVQAVCTGDIAFEYSRLHVTELAESYGLKTFSPLWNIEEDELIKEILNINVIIKSLSSSLELDDLLGKRLDEDAIARLHEKGLILNKDTSDLHTLTIDAPMFSRPIHYVTGKVIRGRGTSLIDIHSAL